MRVAFVAVVCALAALACARHVEHAGKRYTVCDVDADCKTGERCRCLGVGTEIVRCGDGRPEATCEHGDDCGERVCIDPRNVPILPH